MIRAHVRSTACMPWSKMTTSRRSWLHAAPSGRSSGRFSPGQVPAHDAYRTLIALQVMPVKPAPASALESPIATEGKPNASASAPGGATADRPAAFSGDLPVFSGAARPAIRTIVIDPGHGGEELGVVVEVGVDEDLVGPELGDHVADAPPHRGAALDFVVDPFVRRNAAHAR